MLRIITFTMSVLVLGSLIMTTACSSAKKSDVAQSTVKNQDPTSKDFKENKAIKSLEKKLEDKNTKKVTCKMGSDERFIAVVPGDDGGCEVVYNKGGESNIVAQAKNQLLYCDNVMERIQNRLGDAGFECASK